MGGTGRAIEKRRKREEGEKILPERRRGTAGGESPRVRES